MDLLDRVKSLCKKKGITQSKLEKEIGISNGATSKWAKSTPSAEVLQKLSEYFGVSVEYLMTGNSSNIKVVDENNNVVVLDDEALELIDSLRSNPEMRMLFSVSKKATKEDIIKAVKIIEALKDENESD